MDFKALFEDDVETWAELQVGALRRLAASPGHLGNVIDWDNVIEEIEDLGSAQRKAVESPLRNVLTHVLKVWADPHSLSADHWRKEVEVFLADARGRAKRSMLPRMDAERLWRQAVREASSALRAFDREMPSGLPDRSPLSIADLLEPSFDLDAALAKLPIREAEA